MKRVLILGAGTAGTTMANRLHRMFRDDVGAGRMEITVVDQDDRHVYQPGLLFIPFGVYRPDEVVKPRRRQVGREVNYIQATIDRVDADANRVLLTNGQALAYDVLVIATGTQVNPNETEGLTGPGWNETMFDFYTLEGSTALARKLATWPGGRLVVDIVDMPIKCPVAPLEFAFLADWFFTKRGIRDRVQITYVTPLDGAFTKPVCTARLSYLLKRKNIELVTEFNAGTADGVKGELAAWDGRTIPFDLLVAIPVHTGAPFIARTPGLGDDMQFVKVNPNTLQAELRPNIFAIGDATNAPASKAGSVAHFEAELLDQNIRRFLAGEPLAPDFDGHSNCFIETGFDKALLIDFNYKVEPLPGTFPIPGVGPLRLLEESRLNHLGKLAFRHVYWHMLLPGHDIPFVPARMSMRGKRPVAPPAAAPPTAPAPPAAPIPPSPSTTAAELSGSKR